VVYALVGIGGGAKAASWNSFVGSLHPPNELLGLLHGCYGLGATLSPIVASSWFTHHHWKWYQYYYILAGMAAFDMAFSLSAFRTQNGVVYRMKTVSTAQTESPTNAPQIVAGAMPAQLLLKTRLSSRLSVAVISYRNSKTLACFKNKVVSLCSCYLLAYVGSEVALGGWLVTFMVKVRGGSPLVAGLTSSGLWGGITIGRFALGFVTGRFFRTEKAAVMVYLTLAIAMHLLFWLVPNFVASAIFVSLLSMDLKA